MASNPQGENRQGGDLDAYLPSHGPGFELPFVAGELRLAGSDTGGFFSLLEMRLSPNDGPPAHIHHSESEFFYVIEGSYTFHCGEQRLDCGPGAVVRVPPGVAHQLSAGPEGGRHLTMFSPAGPEGWFGEAAELLTAGTMDDQEIEALFTKYGMTRLPAGALWPEDPALGHKIV